MSSFTIEDMLAKRIEELEESHLELWVAYSSLRDALVEFKYGATDLDREDFLNGMTGLDYARMKLRWVRDRATVVLEEMDTKINES